MNVSFHLILVILRILRNFQVVILSVMPDLPCIRMENSATIIELDRNSAVLSKTQNQLNVLVIIRTGITESKIVAALNTPLFPMITDFLSIATVFLLKSCTLFELKLKDTTRDLNRPDRNVYGFVISILLRI